MNLRFSIVIPSYNGKEFLRKALLVLKGSSVQPEKIVVVDDFSLDGTSEMIKSEFPEILLMRNERNLGPTASRNRGARVAEGDCILFMDNDVLVKEDSIEKLLNFLDNKADAGMVGGRSDDENGKTLFYNMGNRFGSGFINRYDSSIPVSWIIESFIAVRKDLFEKLNGFDEDYFMFGEGPDLSERMRKIGFKTYFVNDAIVVKLDGHTHSKWKRKIWHLASILRFWLKHGF